MKTFSILFAALTLLISAACSTTEKQVINAHQLLGKWESVSKEPLNMAQTLTISRAEVYYDPAIGDTVINFDSYKINHDSLQLNYQKSKNYECVIHSLNDSSLEITGLPFREKEKIQFIKSPVDTTQLHGIWLSNIKEGILHKLVLKISEHDIDYSWAKYGFYSSFTPYTLCDDTLKIKTENNENRKIVIRKLNHNQLVLSAFPGMKTAPVSFTKLQPQQLDIILNTDSLSIKSPDKITFTITKEQMVEARTILENFMDTTQYRQNMQQLLVKQYGKRANNRPYSLGSSPLPFNQYYRQYIGEKEEGHIYISVNLLGIDMTNYNYELLFKDWIRVYDGGIYFGTARIDLTNREVIAFALHGDA